MDPTESAPPEHHAEDLGVLGRPGDVSPWDLRFDPDDTGHLEHLGDGRVRLTVRAEPGMLEAWAVVRSASAVVAHPMSLSGWGGAFHWTADVGPEEDAFELSFAFMTASGRATYLVPSGISASVERLDRWTISSKGAPVDVPEWVRGAVIYQIFPDRFANGDETTDPPGTVDWDSPPTARDFHGGDLTGILERVDHLSELGVEVVYLNPVFVSPSNHRYDTIDYFTVDPALGGDHALRRLVTSLHDRRMRIVLDASFNHVHPRFFAFQDLIEHGPESRFRDWFVVHDWPLRIRYRPNSTHSYLTDATRWLDVWERQCGLPIEHLEDVDGPAVDPTYEAWYDVPTMPRLNLADRDARAFALSVATHWITEFDIDGWRMDVARYVDPDFWVDFRRVCRAARPDVYLLAEIMGDVSPWLQGNAFDATMNYTFRDLALGFLAREEIDGNTLLDHAGRLVHRHPRAVTLANQNLIGSHDTPRFLTEAYDERWRLGLATILQLTFPGAPGLYYGDEFGLTGGHDPGSRGTIPWDSLGGPDDATPMIAELTALRREHPALRYGTWAPRAATENAVAFTRHHEGATLVVAINRSATTESLDVTGVTELLWGSADVSPTGVDIPPRAAAIMR